MADGPKIINKLRAMLALTWLLYFHPSSTAGHVSGNGAVQEYCQWETFSASCDAGSVVLMKYARYGRMRFGRCMKEDHGSVGCSADVIKHLDYLCSGRKHCQLNLPDPALHSVLDCPKEIMPYLEASYVCVHVQTGGNQACPIFGSAPLKSTHGNLLLTVPITRSDGIDDDVEERISYHPSSSSSSSFPSMVTVMTPGSPFCPWVIQAKQGQKVNLTLFTFHQIVQTSPDVNNQKQPSPRTCLGSRLVVRDTKSSLEFDVCSRDSRELHLLSTTNHPVKIFLYSALHRSPHSSPSSSSASSSSSSSSSLLSFTSSSSRRLQLLQLQRRRRRRRDLILDDRNGAARDLAAEQPIGLVRYVVEGCAEMEVKNAHVTRDGDEMLVRCNSSSVSFRLTCHDSQWRGDALKCHKAPPTKSMHMLESTKHNSSSQNHGVLVVIGLGVAIGVAFGVFVLFAIVLCHKRKRGRSCVTTTGLFLHNDTLDGQRNFFTSSDHQQQQQLQQQQQQQQHNNAIYFRNNNNKNISGIEDVMISSDFSKSCDHLHHNHHHHHHHHPPPPHYPHDDPLQQNGEGNFCRRQSGEVGQACDPDLYRHASLLVTLEQTPSRRRQSVSQNHQSEILLDDSLELKDGDTKHADTEGSSYGASDEKRIEACDAIFRNNTRHRNQPTGSPFRSTTHSQLTRSFSPDAYPHQPPHYLSTQHHHHHQHHLHLRNHHHHQEHQELTDSNSQLLLLGNESYQQYHLDDEDDAVVIGNGSVTSQKL